MLELLFSVHLNISCAISSRSSIHSTSIHFRCDCVKVSLLLVLLRELLGFVEARDTGILEDTPALVILDLLHVKIVLKRRMVTQTKVATLAMMIVI